MSKYDEVQVTNLINAARKLRDQWRAESGPGITHSAVQLLNACLEDFPPEPFAWLDEAVPGKAFAHRTWREMAEGAEDDGRRKWLRWAVKVGPKYEMNQEACAQLNYRAQVVLRELCGEVA